MPKQDFPNSFQFAVCVHVELSKVRDFFHALLVFQVLHLKLSQVSLDTVVNLISRFIIDRS